MTDKVIEIYNNGQDEHKIKEIYYTNLTKEWRVDIAGHIYTIGFYYFMLIDC